MSETGGEHRKRSLEYLTSGEAAQRLHVSPKTIARWADEGRIPFSRTAGGHRRFHRRDVESIVRQMVAGRTTMKVAEGTAGAPGGEDGAPGTGEVGDDSG